MLAFSGGCLDIIQKKGASIYLLWQCCFCRYSPNRIWTKKETMLDALDDALDEIEERRDQ